MTQIFREACTHLLFPRPSVIQKETGVRRPRDDDEVEEEEGFEEEEEEEEEDQHFIQLVLPLFLSSSCFFSAVAPWTFTYIPFCEKKTLKLFLEHCPTFQFTPVLTITNFDTSDQEWNDLMFRAIQLPSRGLKEIHLMAQSTSAKAALPPNIKEFVLNNLPLLLNFTFDIGDIDEHDEFAAETVIERQDLLLSILCSKTTSSDLKLHVAEKLNGASSELTEEAQVISYCHYVHPQGLNFFLNHIKTAFKIITSSNTDSSSSSSSPSNSIELLISYIDLVGFWYGAVLEHPKKVTWSFDEHFSWFLPEVEATLNMILSWMNELYRKGHIEQYLKFEQDFAHRIIPAVVELVSVYGDVSIEIIKNRSDVLCPLILELLCLPRPDDFGDMKSSTLRMMRRTSLNFTLSNIFSVHEDSLTDIADEDDRDWAHDKLESFLTPVAIGKLLYVVSPKTKQDVIRYFDMCKKTEEMNAKEDPENVMKLHYIFSEPGLVVLKMLAMFRSGALDAVDVLVFADDGSAAASSSSPSHPSIRKQFTNLLDLETFAYRLYNEYRVEHSSPWDDVASLVLPYHAAISHSIFSAYLLLLFSDHNVDNQIKWASDPSWYQRTFERLIEVADLPRVCFNSIETFLKDPAFYRPGKKVNDHVLCVLLAAEATLAAGRSDVFGNEYRQIKEKLVDESVSDHFRKIEEYDEDYCAELYKKVATVANVQKAYERGCELALQKNSENLFLKKLKETVPDYEEITIELMERMMTCKLRPETKSVATCFGKAVLGEEKYSKVYNELSANTNNNNNTKAPGRKTKKPIMRRR